MRYIKEAIKKLDAPEVKVTKTEKIVETEPVGDIPMGKFLNTTVWIETVKEPEELLEFTQSIEVSLGRPKNHSPGPRTLDIDVLSYDGLKGRFGALILPHPWDYRDGDEVGEGS
jgi:2-amino-4-hydroxy-6-hydroxymethyldihydropteridine diphosphokinase